jgi:hypothetical protein
MRRALVVLALSLCLPALVACGDEDSPDTADGATQATKTIDITIEGDSVTPNGERVKVALDQPIELVVKSDTAGEIHVHSSPEQELAYGVGTTTLKMTPIDKPGIVEVESHALEKTIVSLEVS